MSALLWPLGSPDAFQPQPRRESPVGPQEYTLLHGVEPTGKGTVTEEQLLQWVWLLTLAPLQCRLYSQVLGRWR